MRSVIRLSSVVAAPWRGAAVAMAILVTVVLLATSAVAQQPLDLDQAREDRDEAAARQQQLQADLNELLARIGELEAAQEQQNAQIDALGERVKAQRTDARRAASQVASRYREAYKTGTGGDPLVLMFGGSDPQELTERARLLSLMASDSQRRHEAAQGASVQTAALADQLETARQTLAEQTRELESTREEARDKVAQAQAAVSDLDDQIAEEEARRAEARRRAEERRRAAARAAAEREAAAEEASTPAASSSGGSSSSSGGGSSSSGGGGGGGSAPVSGGIACPVGNPRNYSDTYGAPRSGGRSHMGVDILSPMGTPIYAYENGTISRMDSNSLGGISLYLRGASGNVYYYTHLSGYVSGLSTGQSVSAGQQIAYNGDSGNAAGIPHLHWEVQPGGSGNVNPYPYAYRACG